MGTKVSLVLIPFFPIVAFAAQDKKVDINVTAFVEAPTCSVINTGMESFNYDLGIIPLNDLIEMNAQTKGNFAKSINQPIEFKCDGSAKFVNFRFNPTSRDICRSRAKGGIWNFFCNEEKGGATLGVAYRFSWTDKDGGSMADTLISSNRDFDAAESGIIKDGVFTITLKSIFAAAYQNESTQLPGPASYTMGITVWSL